MNKSEIVEAARIAEEKLQWLDAAFLYNQAYEMYRKDEFISKSGWCYSRAGRYNDAISKFLVIQAKEPDSAKWLYMIGYQYYSMGKWSEAVNWYELALEKYPSYFVVKYRLGYSYLKLSGIYKTLTKPEYWRAIGQFQECIELWEKFSEEDKNKNREVYADVCFQFGKSLMHIKSRLQESIQLFEKSLEIKKSDDCQYELAKAFYLIGNYSEAYDSLPNSRKYYVQELSCMIDYKLGHYESALEHTKSLLIKSRKDYICILLSRIYVSLGEQGNAYEVLKDFISDGCENHRLYFEFASICNDIGYFHEARINAEKAVVLRREKYSIDYQDARELIKRIDNNIKNLQVESQEISASNRDKISNQLFGTITSYKLEKGYGFIRSDKTSYFFHFSNCNFKEINVGANVIFTYILSTKGYEAKNIELRN